MSAPQAAAITACTACAAVGGAAAGGAFSSGSTSDTLDSHSHSPETEGSVDPVIPAKNLEPAEPTWDSLTSEVTANPTDYTEGKVGKKYSHFLVGVTGKTNNSNQNWWIKSYEKFTQDQDKQSGKREFSTKFTDKTTVSSAFATTGTSALNKVCEVVYKLATTEIEGEAQKTKIKTDLWRYCSAFDTAPVTVKEKTEDNPTASTIGKTKEEELLSAYDDTNNKFWDYKHEEFIKLTPDPTEKFFKDSFDAAKKNTKKLKDICKDAYTKSSTKSGDNPSEADVVKYCSLKQIA